MTTVIDAVSGGLSNPQNLIKEIGSVIKRTLQGQFTKGFFETWDRLSKEGRVTPDYLNTPHGLATFREMMRALELDDTDQARFEAVQNIFLNDALSNDDRNEIIVIRLLKIASTLNGGEILIIKALAENKSLNSPSPRNRDWEDEVAIATGLKHRAFIDQDVTSLQAKKLITERSKSLLSLPDKPTFDSPKISTLGIELYDYIKSPAENQS